MRILYRFRDKARC